MAYREPVAATTTRKRFMNAPQSIQSQVAALAVLAIGTKLEVGFFGGYINTPNGVFGIEVAPKASEFTGEWLPTYNEVPGACSYFDGDANTAAMAAAGSAIAKKALATEIEGIGGWCIPARDELELLYRGFKPTHETNYTWRSGDNPSSLPAGYPYTETSPAQTSLELFKEGGSEAFDDIWYWASTQSSRDGAWVQDFDDGVQSGDAKDNERRVRLVRRFKA
jgi:hypothetical protein